MMNLDAGTLALLSPIVVGIVRALREIPALKSRPYWLPIVALVVGILASGILSYTRPEAERMGQWAWALVHGVVSGLMAVGLHSGTKNIFLSEDG